MSPSRHKAFLHSLRLKKGDSRREKCHDARIFGVGAKGPFGLTGGRSVDAAPGSGQGKRRICKSRGVKVGRQEISGTSKDFMCSGVYMANPSRQGLQGQCVPSQPLAEMGGIHRWFLSATQHLGLESMAQSGFTLQRTAALSLRCGRSKASSICPRQQGCCRRCWAGEGAARLELWNGLWPCSASLL